MVLRPHKSSFMIFAHPSQGAGFTEKAKIKGKYKEAASKGQPLSH